MNLNQDLGELSPRGRATLLGALALCCIVPMLVVFGVLSFTGAMFSGTVAVVVGAIVMVVWGAWMARHHQHMADQDQAGRDHAGHDA